MLIWDENKNIKLKLERNISFEVISEIILGKKYLDILEHPSRGNQLFFIVELNDYIYSVPFIIDSKSNIVLKTAFRAENFKKNIRSNYHGKY